MRERSLFLLISFVALGSAPALAQSGASVVIAADVEGAPAVPTAQIDLLALALRERGGTVIDPSALAPIAIELSREPRAVSDADVEALQSAVRELETMVAMRQRDAAATQAQRVEELSRAVRDGGSPALATTILSGCLADAWLRLQSGQEADARTRLLACRALHPEVVVDAHTTAPPVHRLLVDVDARLAARATHRVTITGAPDGCEVVLDGRVVGTTPAPIESVPDGDHEVTLRCTGLDHGRIHAMSVSADRTFAIDPSFDQALRTTDGVRLVFRDAGRASAHRVEYGLRLAAIAGASEAELVSTTTTGLRVETATLGQGVIASHELTDAGAETATATDERHDAPSTASSSIDATSIVGIVLGGAGLVTLGVGWGFYGDWSRVSGDYRQYTPMTIGWYGASAQRDYYSQLMLGLALGGSGLAAISVPFWLPPEHDVPWWSWLMGGLGVAVMGTGVALVAIDRGLSNDTLLPGEMLMASSAMFLAVPTTHLFRLAFGPLAPSATIDAGSTHASLVLRGSF